MNFRSATVSWKPAPTGAAWAGNAAAEAMAAAIKLVAKSGASSRVRSVSLIVMSPVVSKVNAVFITARHRNTRCVTADDTVLLEVDHSKG
ncbi:unannotated protein [freshwater metagenome]|uniref:Unannotated protein n=1 Tax=freshwater metagenome TaxID=449393 RepID=A0A6J7BRW9_9ZZZZ